MRMPRSHSITSLVALLEHVLGGHQQLLERRGQAALEQHRAAGAADLGQQRVVLHVARADLDHVGDLEHRLDVARVHQLGDDRQAGLAPWPRRAAAGPPGRAPGTSTATCAACRRRRGRASRPPALTICGGGQRLVARLDRARAGDQREVLAADLAPADLEHGRLAVAELRRGELVRLEDRHDLVDAGVALELEPRRRARGRRSRRSPSPPRRAERCARAPTLSIRAMTAWICSSVAVGFITIIIWWSSSSAPGVTGSRAYCTSDGARSRGPRDAAARQRSRPSA